MKGNDYYVVLIDLSWLLWELSLNQLPTQKQDNFLTLFLSVVLLGRLFSFGLIFGGLWTCASARIYIISQPQQFVKRFFEKILHKFLSRNSALCTTS
jgi:nitric oxide reductase large subunit